ncbi:MAG: hypothetical protein ACRYGP_02640 [Janthinobacterium lividum]
MPLIDIAPFEILTPALKVGIKAKVIGLMLWPDDEHKRFNFIVSNVNDAAQRIAISNNTGLAMDAEFSRLLRDRTIIHPKGMITEALQPVIRGAVKTPNAPQLTPGEIAGQVLIHATHRLKEGQKNIGLNDCLDRVSEDLRRDGAMNARQKDLKHHWHKFRSVSPLWASYLTMRRIQHMGRKSKPGWELYNLLMGAEVFRMDGELISHRNATEGLLPPGSVWQLSGEVKECLWNMAGT